MSEESRTTLKSYFQTNDVPTQSQFENLIDSVPNNNDDYKLYRVDASLSSQEILDGVTKTIVNTPGPEKFINVLGGTFIFKYGTTQYLTVSFLILNHGMQEFMSNSYLNSSVSWAGSIFNYNSGDYFQGYISDTSLYFGVNAANSNGDGTAKVIVYYTIENY